MKLLLVASLSVHLTAAATDAEKLERAKLVPRVSRENCNLLMGFHLKGGKPQHNPDYKPVKLVETDHTSMMHQLQSLPILNCEMCAKTFHMKCPVKNQCDYGNSRGEVFYQFSSGQPCSQLTDAFKVPDVILTTAASSTGGGGQGFNFYCGGQGFFSGASFPATAFVPYASFCPQSCKKTPTCLEYDNEAFIKQSFGLGASCALFATPTYGSCDDVETASAGGPFWFASMMNSICPVTCGWSQSSRTGYQRRSLETTKHPSWDFVSQVRFNMTASDQVS